MNEDHYLVPQHEQGSKTDLEFKVAAETVEEAEYWFVDAKDRMLDVNSWNKYCPGMVVTFRLTDCHGLGVGRHARKRDMIRIDMPGPDGTRLTGFEWESVEAIEYDDYPDLSMETFAMRVRTADSPLNNKDSQAGYVTGKKTSTFVIERRGAKLSATFHRRNDAGSDESMADIGWGKLIEAFLG